MPEDAAAPAMPQDRIRHIVVLMMENRSFDHLFGFRAGVDGLKGTELNLLDPGQPQSLSNPPFQVGTGAPYAIPSGQGQGPGHSVDQTNIQLFGSKAATGQADNSGFVAAYKDELATDHVANPTDSQIGVVMQSFSAAQLPVINALADEFAICDNWHAEVPGPTQPNRLFLHAASSDGHALNNWSAKFNLKTIYHQVADAGFSWASYEEDSNEVREFFTKPQQPPTLFKQMSEFAGDCAGGNLANYVFIAPRMFTQQDGQMINSQHAPYDVRWGEILIADVYEALRGNQDIWNATLLVVIYDEHGGFYDHVVPPAASNPDTPPKNSPTTGDPSYAPVFNFDRLGLRVGAVLVSPWIPKGTVYHPQLQHTSVMKTARDLFGIQASQGNLTNRDAEAATFSDVLSLAAPRTDAPTQLTRPPLPATPPVTDPSHPANKPLDPTQQGIVFGTHHRTRDSHPDETAELLPNTQGEASAFIKARNQEMSSGGGGSPD